MQEIGETSLAIMQDDEKEVERILYENKSRQDPYWIVIFAKPSKVLVEGKPALMRYRKAVFKKPMSQVGLIVGEVNNKNGTVDWEVNLPDAPIGYGALGLQDHGVIAMQTSIPQAYAYNLS